MRTSFKTLTATIISELTDALEVSEPCDVNADTVHHIAEWMTAVCQSKTEAIVEKLKNE